MVSDKTADGSRRSLANMTLGIAAFAFAAFSQQGASAQLLVGAYHGAAAVDAAAAYESWLGRWEDFTVACASSAGYTTDNNIASSGSWELSILKAANRPDRNVFYGVPLSTDEDPSLANTASGKYDFVFQQLATAMKNSYPNAIIRFGWEFNGHWFPWSVNGRGGSAADYIAAFRHVALLFKNTSPGFKIAWITALGRESINPDQAYPGDDIVDIVGADVYDKDFGDHSYASRWSDYEWQPYGLTWLFDFAAEHHHKPIAIPEWAVGDHGTGDNAYFVTQMYLWMRWNHVVYSGYWDSNRDYAGQIDNGQYPKAAATYRNMFGQLP
jgi:beta-mannanase